MNRSRFTDIICTMVQLNSKVSPHSVASSSAIDTANHPEIVELLKQSNTESNNEWVSVAKELPTEEKYGKQVWLYRGTSSENQGSKGQIFATCMVKHCEPDSTWFMPLPQPPKPQNNE